MSSEVNKSSRLPLRRVDAFITFASLPLMRVHVSRYDAKLVMSCSVKAQTSTTQVKLHNDALGISDYTSGILTPLWHFSHLGYSRQCVGAVHIAVGCVEASFYIQKTRRLSLLPLATAQK